VVDTATVVVTAAVVVVIGIVVVVAPDPTLVEPPPPQASMEAVHVAKSAAVVFLTPESSTRRLPRLSDVAPVAVVTAVFVRWSTVAVLQRTKIGSAPGR